MDRRTLLQQTAALGTIATLAGCLDQSGGDETTTEPTTDQSTTNTETTTTEPTTAEPLEITEQEIQTGGTECGETNDASIDFTDDGATVVGTIPATTPCHDAVITSARVFGDVVELTIDTDEQAVDSCQDCLGEIDYIATITTNRPPNSVVVAHTFQDETDTVADESR